MEKIKSFLKELKDHPSNIAALGFIAVFLVATIVLVTMFVGPMVGTKKQSVTTNVSSVNTSPEGYPDIAPSDKEAGVAFQTLASAPKSDRDMKQFLLTTAQNPALPFNVACYIGEDTITAVLPAGVNLSAVKASFSYSGQEVKLGDAVVTSDSTVFDFSKPVTLSLIAKDGSAKTVKVYISALNTGLPSMSINLNNLAPVSSKVELADCSVYAGGGNAAVCSYANDKTVSAKAKVKGRGWTSWYQYPKKSYSLTFNTKQALFDLPASDEWVLAANFADRSLLRNLVASEMAKDLGMESVMEVRPVDLWVNGAYAGNYQLIERIKISNDRVNITEFDPKKSPEQVGYIIETNGHDKAEEYGKYTNGLDADRPTKWKPFGLATYDPINGDIFFNSLHYKSIFVINKPSDTKLNTLPKATAESFVKYIYDYMDKLEAAIQSQNYQEASKYLDMEAMAKWYLVEETTMNTDSRLHCSCYMYKDAGGKMKMGPIWDFDIGLGNGQFTTNYGTTYLDESTWFKDLLTMPEFKQTAKNVWTKNRAKLNNLSRYIFAQADMLKASADVNFKKWEINQDAIWANPEVISLPNYSKQVSLVESFMSQRCDYMDEKLSNW